MWVMFDGAASFKQPMGDLDVPNVEDVRCMSCSASSFNQPIGGWDVECEVYA